MWARAGAHASLHRYAFGSMLSNFKDCSNAGLLSDWGLFTETVPRYYSYSTILLLIIVKL